MSDFTLGNDCSNFVRRRLANEKPGVTCAPLFDVKEQNHPSEQEGSFSGADGRAVRAYDDVVLLRDVMAENDTTAHYLACAGATGTILFFSRQTDGVALLELNFPPPSQKPIVCVYEDQRFLKLHMTNEEKHPR
jgi:hypothetical protein